MLNFNQILEIIPLNYLLMYILGINLLGFIFMFIDKKKAENGSWRIKESFLLTVALIGGSVGSVIGMYTFRHKTKKPRFYILIPVMILLQSIIIILLLINN